MESQLDSNDYDVIIESLKYYRMNIENYDKYPSYEFKQQQLARVDSVASKIRALRASVV